MAGLNLVRNRGEGVGRTLTQRPSIHRLPLRVTKDIEYRHAQLALLSEKCGFFTRKVCDPSIPDLPPGNAICTCCQGLCW